MHEIRREPGEIELKAMLSSPPIGRRGDRWPEVEPLLALEVDVVITYELHGPDGAVRVAAVPWELQR